MTTEQARANEMDRDLFRLLGKAQMEADASARGSIKAKCWWAAVDAISAARIAVRARMSDADRAATR